MQPAAPIISSVHNQWVKYARSLDRRKARSAERAFLVEGTRLVADALAAGATPRLCFYDPDTQPAGSSSAIGQASDRGARIVPVTATVMRALSDTDAPQGIVAVFAIPELPIPNEPTTVPLYVVADAIRDPGNLGTLIRSAAGAGAQALFVAPGTTDPFAPKVVRAGMGAQFRLPVRGLDWTQPDPALVSCRQRLVATTGAAATYDSIDWTRPSCLIIGNEAAGLSDAARALSTGGVSIPLAAGIESLNAAVAGAVVLFEAARQRRRQELRAAAG